MTHPTPLQRIAFWIGWTLRGIPVLLLVATAGCFPINRTCTDKRCWVEASPEQIDRHCRKGAIVFDSGEKPSAFDGKRVRCCVKLRSERYWIFVASDSWNCLVHEECHIDEHESGRKEHWRCHGFGADRDGRSQEYIDRGEK